ncbi:hypothetical protein ASG52_00200 [Methylobacterium sp. Leaf456]|uniref:GGDEF domain-containing protein n=1 Tax=Methylobacterium sp. Leaf456 TaxID=1736382 RepID=UPI000700DAAF|nr:GGDEF domain-containing protein [Methylobacterium sp. Leaf456]KQT61347.1 hypothetical protein ASG52_00200 [Methylobacterium sp. Leaf456]
MNSATFLLVFNFAIGAAFAVAFLGLTWRSGIALGRWCALGFLSASATVAVEGFGFLIPSVRAVSALSFGLLMLALTLIAAGLSRTFRPDASLVPLFVILAASAAFNALVVFDLPRGGWGQALGYQLPFAAMLGIAAAIVLGASRRRAIDLALAAILILSAAQFVAKAVLAGLAGSGPGVRDYLASTYAFYSQTAGGILSLLLGLTLFGLMMVEVIEAARLSLQRDGLSGLLNRGAFTERAVRALAASPPGARTSLILCDLDRFKGINDRFGHAAGDEAIRAFGERLRVALGPETLCGRIGGEEFCILLPACDAEAACARIEAIRALGQGARYALIPDDVAVTASFGIAVTDRSEPYDAALRRADLALYAAKAAGRDRFCLAAPGAPLTPPNRPSAAGSDGSSLRVRGAGRAGPA